MSITLPDATIEIPDSLTLLVQDGDVTCQMADEFCKSGGCSPDTCTEFAIGMSSDCGCEVATTVLDILLDDSDTFSSLVSFAQIADLADALGDLDDITLFAPDNNGFLALVASSPVATTLLQSDDWQPHLQNLLKYHIVPERIASSDINNGQTVETLSGDSLEFLVNKNGRVFINKNVRIDNADTEADNGIVHTIESLLLPDWVNKNLIDVIKDIPLLATINDLIAQADLIDTFTQEPGEGNAYTIFAPTNEAIQNDLEALAATDIDLDDSETVTAILQQHVIEGVRSASTLESGVELDSALGTPLVFEEVGGTMTVNGITIISSDNLANNGIVHIIDGLILPPSLTAGGGA